MMRFYNQILLLFLFPVLLSAQNQPPVIQNLSAEVDWNTNTLTIRYDALDAENDNLDVKAEFSTDGGKSYLKAGQVPMAGDVGYIVLPGTGRTITCNVSQFAGAGALFLVRLSVQDGNPVYLDELVAQVDSNRLRADLEFIEGIRHRTTGLSHLNAVRDSIEQRFLAMGLYAEEQTFPYGGYTGRNILGTHRGNSFPDKTVIVDAHYDTVSDAPGADDNGSGVAGVLEIARILSRYPVMRNVRFIGFDLEETGVTGSTRYVTSGIPADETVAGVFNFEMIGYFSEQPNSQTLPTGFNLLFPAASAAVAANQYRGDFITNVGNDQFPEITNLFKTSAQQFVPDLKVITVSEPIGLPVPDLRRSDHAPFWLAGLPAIMITDGANFRNECYHTPSDTLDGKLNFTFMSRVVKATLAAAAQLAQIQHGDWALVSFPGTVPVEEPLYSCRISAGAYPGAPRHAGVYFGECPLSGLTLRLYDPNGRLLHRDYLDAPSGQGWYQLGTQELNPGIYFLDIRNAHSHRMIKMAIF